MSDAPKAKPPNLWMDLLWFLGIMAMFFFLWVWGGGPERARQHPPSPVLNGRTNIAPSYTDPVAPTSPQTSSPTQSGNTTSGEIEVTPI